VFVAVLGNAIADNHARIADGSRDGQHLEIALREITQVVQVVHFVVDKKERVLRVVGRGGGTNNHAGGVRAIAGDAVRGAGVATQRSQIRDGEYWLAAGAKKSADQNGDDSKTKLGFCAHRRLWLPGKTRFIEKRFGRQGPI
jgi:hypothetical protein